MDKNLLRALFWAFLVFVAWQIVAVRIWPPPAPTASPDGTAAGNVSTNGATQGAPTATDAPGPTGNSGSTGDSGPASHADDYHAMAVEATTVVLGSTNGFKESPYRMQLEFTSRGAALETAKLSDHRVNVGTEKRYELLCPIERNNAVYNSLAIEQVTVDGRHPVDMDQPVWGVRRYETDGAHVAEFTATIARGETPVLELVRTVSLPAQSRDEKRHDVSVTLTVRNLTDESHTVIVQERGPVGITSQGSFTPDQKVFTATRLEGYVDLETKTFKEVAKSGIWRALQPGNEDRGPLVWLGGGNLYFTCTMCPLGTDGTESPGYIAAIDGVDLDGKRATEDDITTRQATQPIALEGGAAQTLHAAFYIGPKDREAFKNHGHADYLARDYMLQIKDGYGSCTFNVLTDLMIELLNWLEGMMHNFGVAIIVLVVIVRVLLHPITKKTQVNMVMMQQGMGALQPKMEAIKKKYPNDNAKVQQETMKLYREEGINPLSQMLGCLPMLLQMPIWIALYSSLRNNVEMRGRGFVWWIEDLTASDDLWVFDPPLFGSIEAFHLLPILVGIMMFAQQKLMPKPARPAASSNAQGQQAEQMQKMMPYMSLVMIFLFYKFPSGLNLYIMASSLFGAVEQWYIRGHIKDKEAEGPKPTKPQKPRKSPSLFEKLQKRAEEAQRVQSSRDKDKKHR